MYTIITGNKCKFCETAKNLLIKEGIKFDEINITDRETAKRVFKVMGGTTVPRIYDEQGQLIGGIPSWRLSLKNWICLGRVSNDREYEKMV